MAVGLIVFKRLGSGTKVVTRIRGLSIRTKVRGLFKTGTPGLVFISTPANLDPPNKPGPELDTFRNFIHTVQGYDRKDGQVKVAHTGINHRLGVKFEKEKIRRVQTIPQVVEVAKDLGWNGDVEKWINEELDLAANKPGRSWFEVFGDGKTLPYRPRVPPPPKLKPGELPKPGQLIRRYFS
ncbi:hypothetical protein K440DRAFT_619825 [Wilcoxina mikolae CBS 423.85]|nr:hypothetical protein K440DRAFT_619825 [Wilcoxina mikolae CBS 423.85]